MLFSDDFLEALSADPIPNIIVLGQKVTVALAAVTTNSQNWNSSEHEIYLEAFALLKELTESELIDYPPPIFEIGSNASEDCGNISSYFHELKKEFAAQAQQKAVNQHQKRFKLGLGKSFAFEFSKGDYERIQTLINELRALISESKGFEKEHQRRLLARLERLQTEIHKKVSDLDRFWGLIGDAGVVLGKLGNDAKPIVDRIREIAGITWNTQSRAEELPSGTSFPQLEHKPSDDA